MELYFDTACRIRLILRKLRNGLLSKEMAEEEIAYATTYCVWNYTNEKYSYLAEKHHLNKLHTQNEKNISYADYIISVYT